MNKRQGSKEKRVEQKKKNQRQKKENFDKIVGGVLEVRDEVGDDSCRVECVRQQSNERPAIAELKTAFRAQWGNDARGAAVSPSPSQDNKASRERRKRVSDTRLH